MLCFSPSCLRFLSSCVLSFPLGLPETTACHLREDVVMIVCVMLCVGRCKLGAVERRSWLGLGGVGIVVASGVAAYGVCSGFGEKRCGDAADAGSGRVRFVACGQRTANER